MFEGPLKNPLKPWAILSIVVLAGGLLWSVNHYREKYHGERKRADDATTLAGKRLKTIHSMERNEQDVAALDAKYTKELADAREELDRLNDGIDSGKYRVYIAARCPSVRTGSTATGVADATGPRLTNAAQRDYIRLRKRSKTATEQIAGLQEYIRLRGWSK